VAKQRNKPSGAPDENKPGGGNLGPARRGISILESVGVDKTWQSPTPVTYGALTGRAVATDVVRDRVMSGKPQVVIVSMGQTEFGFYSGNAAAPANIATIGTFYGSLYPSIVRILESERSVFIRDTTLDNAGADTSVETWLEQYSLAFLALRGLEGWLNAGNINYTTSLISAAINNNLFRLEAALRRLYTFSIPPMLATWLDRLCGPKMIDVDSPIVGHQYMAAGNDISTSVGAQNCIGLAESALSVLTAPAANVVNDYQRIANTFALAYGPPATLPRKQVSTDPIDYAMFQTQAMMYADSTAVKTFTWPNSNPVPNTVPLLIPKGATGDALHQYLTFFRPTVFSNDAVAGVSTAAFADVVGLFQTQQLSTHGTEFVSYGQNGVVGANNSNAAGIVTLGYNQVALDNMFWAAEANAEAVDYTTETRNFRGYDRVYVSVDFLIDETLYALEEIFLASVLGQRSRNVNG